MVVILWTTSKVNLGIRHYRQHCHGHILPDHRGVSGDFFAKVGRLSGRPHSSMAARDAIQGGCQRLAKAANFKPSPVREDVAKD